MGHLGHGFHNNLHYHRRQPYGPLCPPFAGCSRSGRSQSNPVGWLFVYWEWQGHRERKKANVDKATGERHS